MFTKKLKVHFIGIGGIGVSALAKYYLEKGWQVSGSDLVSSEITKALKKMGAKIFIGAHQKCLKLKFKQLPDLVIYSPAVQSNNPEFKEAKKRKAELLSYPEALGRLTKKYFTIAVSGTHGKSTTTTMIGLLLKKAGFDPTVIVGTKVKEFASPKKNGEGSNCRVGKSQYLVIEADEWNASFLNYWPKIIVLTNIEREHLDYYKNLRNILKTYKEYINHLPGDGILVINGDDKNITKVISSKKLKKSKGDTYEFYLKQGGARRLKKILKVPGEYNIYNALAALTVARALKIPDKISFKALSEYKGAWRRFEIKQSTINKQRLTIISDYGHHPTEVEATLRATREKFPQKKIWCVFQPHQYQRTFYLFNDFVKVFKGAPLDKLIITDIYDVAGREEKRIKEKISSEKLIKAIKKPQAIYIPTLGETKNYLKKNLQGGEVVIIMGAGDIYKLDEQF